MLRYLNMFVLIGVALIGISIAGLASQGRFLQEPGQAINPMASLIYLGGGILMLVNGYVSIRQASSKTAVRQEKPAAHDTAPQTTTVGS
ncbi:MAG TPA: hypothetical protein VGS41_13480 [Chthonomonadales bacterium]|nr:hypothetical protein [Chthonomonadales bacterium]